MPTQEKKQKKKLLFTEEGIATLIQRYDARTVLTLLQEVANYPNPKIDWNELVKKTSTHISNAREYQLLWRHLAYRHALPENLGDAAEPMDDDSDLECDMEALPPISADSASEAAACVKVIIESRMLSESTPSSSMIEAPLPVNVPVCHSSSIPNKSSELSNLMQRKNIIFPVTIQRQPLQTVSSAEGIETKGIAGGSMTSKRKRNAWSEKEDMQLRAAVERWGEGNWATIAKGDSFRVQRSPLQLAQRWGSLRKKSGSTIQATNKAIFCAIDPPSNRPLKKPTLGATNPACTPSNTTIKGPVQQSTIKGPVQQSCNVAEASTARSNFATAANNPSQKVLLDTCGYPEKSKSIPETPVAKCNPTTESSIKANTVVTGARLLSSSDTVPQIKVAQANTVPVVGLCSNPKVHSDVSGARTGTSIASAPVASRSATTVTSPACISTMKSPLVNKVQQKQEVVAVTGTGIPPAPVTTHPAATVTSLVPCSSTVKSPPVNKGQQKQGVVAATGTSIASAPVACHPAATITSLVPCYSTVKSPPVNKGQQKQGAVAATGTSIASAPVTSHPAASITCTSTVKSPLVNKVQQKQEVVATTGTRIAPAPVTSHPVATITSLTPCTSTLKSPPINKGQQKQGAVAATGTSIASAPVTSHPAATITCTSTVKSPLVNKVQQKQEVVAATGTSIVPAPVTSHPAATIASLAPCTSTLKSPLVNKVQQKQEVVATGTSIALAPVTSHPAATITSLAPCTSTLKSPPVNKFQEKQEVIAATGTSIAPAPVTSHPAATITSLVPCTSTVKSLPVNEVQQKQEVVAATGTSIAPAPVASHPAATVTSLGPCTTTVKSPPVNKVQQKQEHIATEEFKVSDTRLAPKDMVQAYGTPTSATDNHHMPDLKKEDKL